MSKSTKGADTDQHIKNLVANWPPLTPEQRDKLRILLRPAARTGDQASTKKDEWDV